MTDRSYERVARLVLLAILWLGLAGTETELLLLKHTDGGWQLFPIILIGVGIVVLLAHAGMPGPTTIRAIQATMAVFVISGALGIVLHYKGNVEWELERMASLAGLDLFKHAVMGATPTLAPGTMVQLGLVGLLFAYQHPAARDSALGTRHSAEHGESS